MVDETHSVIKILISRMETHPDEFMGERSRWTKMVAIAERWGTDAESQLLRAALREVHLRALEDKVLDEIMNGQDREKASASLSDTYNAQLARQLQTGSPQSVSGAYTTGLNTIGQYADHYQNSYPPILGPAQGLLMGGSGSGKQLSIGAEGTISWPSGVSLDESTMQKIKRKLGI